jgi:sugar/nucleoside kinase (ribokinase family)
MKKYDLYSIGNALLDMVYQVPEDVIKRLNLEKGTMTLIDENTHNESLELLSTYTPTYACGGSAANTAITAQLFGSKTFYSSLVGQDTSGRLYHQDLVAKGVDSNITEINRPDADTGKCLALVTPDAQRTMSVYLGITAQLTSQVIDAQAIEASRFLYIEGYLVANEAARQAAISAKNIAEKHEVKIALTLSDTNMINLFRQGVDDMLGQGVDLLFCNEQEALAYASTQDLDDAELALRGIAKQYVITLGNEGAIAFDGKRSYHLKAYDTPIIDSVGAGDTFAGSFLHAINNGADFAYAADFANYAAAKVVSKIGPRLEPDEALEISQVFSRQMKSQEMLF